MKKSSTPALLALSLIFLLPAFMILSPDGRLICLVLAGLSSAAALILGTSWVKRAAALIVLVIVVFQSFATYSEYKALMDAYRKNALKHSEQKPGPGPK